MTQTDKVSKMKTKLFAVLVPGILVSCEHAPTAANPPRLATNVSSLAPVPDVVMGRLSGLARHIAAGLEDPIIRSEVLDAMKSPGSKGLGLDLENCASAGTASRLLSAGEKRGTGTCTHRS